MLDQWDAPAASARGSGLADEEGGRWRLLPKGRDLARQVRAEADAYFATLAPLSADETTRLAGLLQRALDAIEASDVPHDHMRRTARLRGDARIPMVALENAVFGLWQARDDCHMSAWRERGFDGPTFDVLTRVWRQEATRPNELAAKLAQQRPADVAAALERLRASGLVERASVTTTTRGAALRREIEDDTDRRFFAPWPDDVGAAAGWIADRLGKVNAALAPAP